MFTDKLTKDKHVRPRYRQTQPVVVRVAYNMLVELTIKSTWYLVTLSAVFFKLSSTAPPPRKRWVGQYKTVEAQEKQARHAPTKRWYYYLSYGQGDRNTE